MNPADRYDLVSSQFDRLVRDVPAERWGAPSPCDGWSAEDVLRHVVDTERELFERMGFTAPDVDGLAPVDAWAAVRAAMSDALADPVRRDHAYDGHFGPTTFARTVDDFYSFDLVVHRWDIARATGLAGHERIAPDEIERLRASAAGFGAAMRMPGIFGPELPAAEGADEQDRFLAWIGRDTSGAPSAA